MPNFIYEYTKKYGLKENTSFYDFLQKYDEYTNEIYHLGNESEVALIVSELATSKNEDMPFLYIGIIHMESRVHQEIGLRDYNDVLEFINNYKDIVTDYYKTEEIKQKIYGNEE